MPELPPILFAIMAKDEELALKRIQAGCDPDYKDPRKELCALHAAAFLGMERVVAALIAAGADVNIADHSGGTPLDKAANRRIGRLLERAGARFSRPDAERASSGGTSGWPSYDLDEMLRSGDLIAELGGRVSGYSNLTAGEKMVADINQAYRTFEPELSYWNMSDYQIAESLAAVPGLRAIGAVEAVAVLETIMGFLCPAGEHNVDKFLCDQHLMHPSPEMQDLRRRFVATRKDVERRARSFVSGNQGDFR